MGSVLIELLSQPFRGGHRSHSSIAIRHGRDGRNIAGVTVKENDVTFVLLIYQGTTPLPGSDSWKGLSEAEQKQIYTDYAELNQTAGITQGLPLGMPDAAKTVQVRSGQTHVKDGTHLAEGAAGYAVYEAASLDAAIALAARIPAARLGGAVEIRPAEKYW
jgi:hypothetical protein